MPLREGLKGSTSMRDDELSAGALVLDDCSTVRIEHFEIALFMLLCYMNGVYVAKKMMNSQQESVKLPTATMLSENNAIYDNHRMPFLAFPPTHRRGSAILS